MRQVTQNLTYYPSSWMYKLMDLHLYPWCLGTGYALMRCEELGQVGFRLYPSER